MQLFNQLERISYIHKLIKKRITGNPKNLAAQLRISERQLYNIIEELKLYGFPIEYDKKEMTYFYTEEFEFSVKIKINNRLIF